MPEPDFPLDQEAWAEERKDWLGETLQEIWFDQFKFNVAVNDLDHKERSKEELAQTYILGLLSEADEVLRRLNWKYHRRQDKPPVDRTALMDDLADLEKYVLCLWHLFDVSLPERLQAIQRKSSALWQVLGSEFSSPAPGQRVLIVDLDNTLARYTEGLIRWMGGNRHVAISRPHQWASMDMPALFRLTLEQYRPLKQAWERGELNSEAEPGGYAMLEAYDAWVTAVRRCREAGMYVVICTARPQEESKQVWYDCWAWCKTHLGEIDRMAFMSEGRVALASEYHARGHEIVVLEDNPILVRTYLNWPVPIPVVMHEQAYNIRERDFIPLDAVAVARGHSDIRWEDIKEVFDVHYGKAVHTTTSARDGGDGDTTSSRARRG